jgi:hypothetical protein
MRQINITKLHKLSLFYCAGLFRLRDRSREAGYILTAKGYGTSCCQSNMASLHEVAPDALPYYDQGYEEPGVREMVGNGA